MNDRFAGAFSDILSMLLATGIDVSLSRIALGFFASLGVAVLAIRILQSRQSSLKGRGFLQLAKGLEKGATDLEILERLRVLPNCHLCLVRCGERRYLLLLDHQSCRIVERQPDIEDSE